MSLRKIAKELGVSHTLLVLWRQGKRNLSPELQARYHKLVAASGYKSGYKSSVDSSPPDQSNTRIQPPWAGSSVWQSIGLLIRVSWVRIPAGSLFLLQRPHHSGHKLS